MNIGDNGGPPLDPLPALAADIADLVAEADGVCAIETAEQADQVDDLLDRIKASERAIEDARTTEKAPHLQAGRAVDERYRPLTKSADAAKGAVVAVLTPWKAEQKRLRDEAAAKLRAEAEAKEAAALAAMQSDDLAMRIDAETAIDRARKARATANKIERAATGLRTYREAEIVDYRAALNHYVRTQREVFVDCIETLAKRDASAGARDVPGVIFHERSKAA